MQKQQIKTTIGNTVVRNTTYLRKLRILPPPGSRVSQELGSSLIAPSNQTGLLVPDFELWGGALLLYLPYLYLLVSTLSQWRSIDQGEPMESISRNLPD